MTNSYDKALSRRRWIGLASTATVGTGLLSTTDARAGTPDHDLGARTYNIRDFGAKGDGAALDTAAVAFKDGASRESVKA